MSWKTVCRELIPSIWCRKRWLASAFSGPKSQPRLRELERMARAVEQRFLIITVSANTRLPVSKNSRLKCGRSRPAFEQILQIAEVCLHRSFEAPSNQGFCQGKDASWLHLEHDGHFGAL